MQHDDERGGGSVLRGAWSESGVWRDLWSRRWLTAVIAFGHGAQLGVQCNYLTWRSFRSLDWFLLV